MPIACDLFEGNTNGCETLLPVLKKEEGERPGRVVVVADDACVARLTLNGVCGEVMGRNDV